MSFQGNAFGHVSVKEFGPTGTADDSATFQRAINAVAGTGHKLWIPGNQTYRLSTGLSLVGLTDFEIVGSEGAILDFTLSQAIVFTTASIGFLINGATFAPNLGLAANVAQGSLTIQTNVAPTVGEVIGLFRGPGDFSGGLYTVQNVSAGPAPFTVTLDRPTYFSFSTVTDSAFGYSQCPQRIRITGNGMRLTGVGQRMIEAQGIDITVRDLILDNSASGFVDYLASHDTASYKCQFIDIWTLGDSGPALEGSESCSMIRCLTEFAGAPVGSGHGILLNDNVNPYVENCSTYHMATGIIMGSLAQGSDGNHEAKIYGGMHLGYTLAGINMSSVFDSLIHGVTCSQRAQAAGTVGIISQTIDGNNIIEGCTTTYNQGGIACLTAGTTVNECDCSFNSEFGVQTHNNTIIDGLRATGCGVAGGNPGAVSIIGGKVILSNFSITLSVGTSTGVFCNAAAQVFASNGAFHLQAPAASFVIAFAFGNGQLTIRDCYTDDNGVGAFAISANAPATVRTSYFQTTATIQGTAFYNRAQVLGSAAGPVAVPWPALQPQDRVVLVATGAAAVATPAVILTPATGFTISIDPSGTTWNYVVE